MSERIGSVRVSFLILKKGRLTERGGCFEVSLLGAVGFELVAQAALFTLQRIDVALQVIHRFFEVFFFSGIEQRGRMRISHVEDHIQQY